MLGMGGCENAAPPADVTPPPSAAAPSDPVFRLRTADQTGVNFVNFLPEDDQFNILAYEYYYNGGGVAIGDVNGDDLPDLFFTANLVANRLYLNQGNLTFREASQEAGLVSRPGWKTGVAMADVNADGHLDIYICRSGKMGEASRRNELFLNQGNGTFREAAAEVGLDDAGYSTHASFFDYDRDGDLDCFVLNHALRPNFNLSVAQVKGQRSAEFGDRLYRNDNGRFTDVSVEAGIIGNPIGFGLSVTVEDFDRDGWLDIFVANDYTEQDYLYRNLGNGRFEETLAPALAHTSHFSMGSDAGDINGDGWSDLMVLDMLPEDNYGQKVLKGPDNYDRYQMQVQQGFYHQQMRNTLQLNLGRGLSEGQGFSEVGQLVGVSNTDWSWSPLFADFDNDGDLDLHVTNGYVRASTHLDFVKYDYPAAVQAAQDAGQQLRDGEVSKRIPQIRKTNAIFRNEGGGWEFARVTREWGIERPSFSQGAAYADLDQDGDLDLVVNNIGEEAFVYENVAGGNSLRLTLAGSPNNPFAYGARVEVALAGKTLPRTLIPSRGFQSSVEPVLHWGLGEATAVEAVTIIWPDGTVQEAGALPAGTHRLSWEAGLPRYQGAARATGGIQAMAEAHRENDWVDFRQQPLLPHMLSRLGPCLAAPDLNGDQQPEIVLGGGAGQAATRWAYQLSGDRLRWQQQPIPGTAAMEATDLIAFDADGDGDEDLLLLAGGNEPDRADALYQDLLLLNDGGQLRPAPEALPAHAGSSGCAAAGDVDGDGDLDLFIGGRVQVGQYPLAPKSQLLVNEGGRFVDRSEQYLGDPALGMVSDARWADLDGDEQPELILLGEWMPIRIFGNKDGRWQERSDEWGLSQSTGWWTRLEVADLDGDGDLDLITGSMGENTQWKARPEQPLGLYAADFDNNGTIDPILTYRLDGQEVPIANRDELLAQLRFLQKKFPRYEDYARATISDILTPEQMNAAMVIHAGYLRSGWWEQTEAGFVFHAWPNAAQVAPVYGQTVGDFDADGSLEVLLAGNFYPTRAETGRFDASVGVLLDDEGGGFAAVSPTQSGIYLPGDVRDLLALPVSAGRYLLVAARNGEPAGMQLWQMQPAQ